MDLVTDDPYRATPVAPVAEPARPFVRRRHWGHLVATVLAMAAGPGALLILTACVGFDWLGTADERRKAYERLRALPFPITHDRPSVITNDDPRPIVSVKISLDQPMGDRDGEAWYRAANERAPGLTVIADGTTITLTSWSWRKQDLVLLAQLLDSWGGELHAARGIRSVDVSWAARRGPPQGI